MFDVIMTKVLPVNLIFLIGYILKDRGILKEEDGGVFLRFVFYVLTPAMLFNSTRKMNLSWEIMLYPLLIVVVQGLMHMVGRCVYGLSKSSHSERPVVVSSLMVMNGGFIIPFFIAFYGQEEIWRVGLFDFANALITFSITYSIFLNSKTGKSSLDFKGALQVFKSPPVVGIFLGFIFNFFKIGTPETLNILADNLTVLLGPLVMLSLGLFFNPKISRKLLTVSIVFIKFIVGGMIATALSAIFGLEGATRAVLYLMACSPVGTNILTFSVISESDMNLASGVVSLSTIINLILIPALLIVLNF